MISDELIALLVYLSNNKSVLNEFKNLDPKETYKKLGAILDEIYQESASDLRY